MSGSCLEGVWRVSVGCVEGVLKGSGRCLEGVWKVSLRGLGSMQLYASMQICNHACMPVCRYIIVHVYGSIQTKLWPAQKEKLKENSSVALLSPTCLVNFWSRTS